MCFSACLRARRSRTAIACCGFPAKSTGRRISSTGIMAARRAWRKLGFDRLVRTAEQLERASPRREGTMTAATPSTSSLGDAGQAREAAVDGDDRSRRRRRAGPRPRRWRGRASGRPRARRGGGRGCRAPAPQKASSMIVEARQRDRDREPAGRHCRFRTSTIGIGHDRDRAHRGEVVAADRDGQQQRAVDLPLDGRRRRPTWQAAAPISAPSAIDATTSDGIPDDPALRSRRPPCRCSAWRRCRRRRSRRRARRAGQRARQRNAEADAGQHDGGDQRQDRQGDVVAARNAGRERQHRDEMRRPDAEAGRRRGHGEPDVPHVAGRLADVMEQVDRGERGQRADDGREDDQPEVVLLNDAVVDL